MIRNYLNKKIILEIKKTISCIIKNQKEQNVFLNSQYYQLEQQNSIVFLRLLKLFEKNDSNWL